MSLRISLLWTFVATLCSVMLCVSTAFAQEPIPLISNATATATSAVGKIEPRTDTQIAQVPDTALDPRAQERIMNLGKNISMRIDALTRRFEHIAIRLESRMNKLEKMGYDTTQARARVAEAYTSLQDIHTHRMVLDTLPTHISSDTPRMSYATVRQTFVLAQMSIIRTHTLLTETVALLSNPITQEAASPTGTTTSNIP